MSAVSSRHCDNEPPSIGLAVKRSAGDDHERRSASLFSRTLPVRVASARSNGQQTWAGRRGIARLATVLAFSASMAATSSAHAQNDPCAETAFGGALNCTANDGSLSALKVLGTCTSFPSTYCTADSECPSGTCNLTIADGCDFIGDTAYVRLQATLNSPNATERYDVGIYIATDGGNALVGQCLHEYLPPPLSTAVCTQVGNTGGDGPYCNASTDPNNVCGDIANAQGPVTYNLGYRPPNPPAAAVPPTLIPILCVDTNNDGFVELSGVSTYAQV